MGKDFIINSYEDYDRQLVTNVLTQWTSNLTDVVITPTEIKCSVDLKMQWTSTETRKECDFEIKTLNGNYPNFILKQDKLQRMFNEAGDKALVYTVINPETDTIYFFNCRTIDWSSLKLVDMWQYICEADHSLGKKKYPTYFIPRSLAYRTSRIS